MSVAAQARAGEFAGGMSALGFSILRRRSACRDCVLAARQLNAAPSLMPLLQSVAGRAWKDELSRDLDLLRQEMQPQLKVEGLPDFERL